MRSLFSIISVVLIFNSCTTSIVNQKKTYADNKLKLEKKYTIITSNGTKQELRISKIDSVSIFGKDVSGEEKLIEKSKITEIKKPNTLGTVGLLAGLVAGAVMIPAYADNKPVGK